MWASLSQLNMTAHLSLLGIRNEAPNKTNGKSCLKICNSICKQTNTTYMRIKKQSIPLLPLCPYHQFVLFAGDILWRVKFSLVKIQLVYYICNIWELKWLLPWSSVELIHSPAHCEISCHEHKIREGDFTILMFKCLTCSCLENI